ncbi:TonB-dependent receptor [Acidihalobacter yilgarnensis]|uniref:TonB-dependent receptor n=1 Tax=Acidihalobacter yilgarnensis TaxID=2819280 RepID=A0A1D8IKS4_9GAMM|nr:TonB-dependent receptor [Acidihalobacter yilgarnensis]AOU97079.1 TonB-dependent receptor [Acidihalobacter yilgarnensis]
MCGLFTVRPIMFALVAFAASVISPMVFAAGETTMPKTTKPQADINVGEVSATVGSKSGELGNAVKSLTPEANFKSGQSVKVLGRHEVTAAGPVGGSAQALSYAPGISVSGYGGTGATKNSISVNGIKQGWGGFAGGQIDDGSLSVTFDGVPMVDPSTGLWESPEVPQLDLLQGIGITYGPGNPLDRWYNNIGGQIAFVPLQPTRKVGGSVKLTYGSYGSRKLFVEGRTGSVGGWSTIVAGGMGSSNSYRTSSDGFLNPSYNYAWFAKTIKTFSNGDFSAGAYLAKGSGYRPVPIPINPIVGVTMNGTANSPLYSQQTSGYYAALPGSVWHKQDTNGTWLLYSKLNVEMDQISSVHNIAWYRHGYRVHFHYNNYGLSNPSNLYEYNNPHDDVYGDKLWFSVDLPYDELDFGGFFLNSQYNSRNAFYNSNSPYYGSAEIPNASYRSDYWDQTDIAAFIQDRISPVANVHVTPGVRVIKYFTRYYPAALQDFAQAYALYPSNNQGQLPPSKNNFSKIEPSLDFNWKVQKNMAIFANYSIAHKEPQVGGGGGLYQSTPAVYSLERSTDFNVGVKIHVPDERHLHDFLLSASYYHLHYANQYIPLYDTSGNYLGDANGDSTYQGINLAVTDKPYAGADVFANLNVEKAIFTRYVTGGVSYDGLPVSNVPDSTFNIGGDYNTYVAGGVLTPRTWYQYCGAQAIFNDNTGAPSRQKLAGYGTLNLGVDYTIPTASSGMGLKDIKLSLDVLNVTDSHYNVFEYITGGGLLGGNSAGQALVLPGAPLTIYSSLSANF